LSAPPIVRRQPRITEGSDEEEEEAEAAAVHQLDTTEADEPATVGANGTKKSSSPENSQHGEVQGDDRKQQGGGSQRGIQLTGTTPNTWETVV
jgi:hypothetical protein